MTLPSPQEFLEKLNADPQAAAAFDRATQRDTPGRSRKDAVFTTLAALTATITANAALKAQVAASKAKLDALETARITNARLKSSLAIARGKLAKPSPAPVSLTPLLDSFNAMNGFGRTTFYQKNERAIRLEILRANSPDAIIPNH